MSEERNKGQGLSRRDLIKNTGLAIGGLAVGSKILSADEAALQCGPNACGYPENYSVKDTETWDYPNTLREFSLNDQQNLDDDEMRITFLGSNFPPARRTQQLMSVFVEVGPWVKNTSYNKGNWGRAADSFVFDIGPGTANNYGAAGISYGRMDKVFIAHLHGDHMGDLPCVYCFGPSEDRKTPLYVFGQSQSGVKVPAWGNNPSRYYNDGTRNFCYNLRESCRWHTESFSFLPTNYGPTYPIPTKDDFGTPQQLVPVSDDPPYDGYAIVPVELNWKKPGIAYNNPSTGVKVTHFPVIHARQGSMGFKLEWNGLSMVYSSDTRPETYSQDMASGVDVFIHEMILPPDLLAMKNKGMDGPDPSVPGYPGAVYMAKTVEESSHSPQGAYGCLLSGIKVRPKLSVIAHFPAANDTVDCALKSVRKHFPGENYPVEGKDIVWACDFMVLRVKKNGNITQWRTRTNRFGFSAPMNFFAKTGQPKYHKGNTNLMDPTQQLDLSTFIGPGPKTWCRDGY